MGIEQLGLDATPDDIKRALEGDKTPKRAYTKPEARKTKIKVKQQKVSRKRNR